MKVLVVSQQRWLGESLVALLRSSVCEEGTEITLCTTDSVVEAAQTARADTVLLDMSSDVVAGITLVRRIKEVSPATHLVALGSESDETVVYQAVLAGADGYLLPDTSAETLASTLRGVMRGELGLSRAVALTIVRRLRDAASMNPSPMSVVARAKLTQREREVFELVLRGLRSRDIGRQLYIAESTVYKHIQNILDKLRMQSRAQAIFSVHNDEHASPPVDSSS
jgi:DNA-binding NarL/FixJ family response regulator